MRGAGKGPLFSLLLEDPESTTGIHSIQFNSRLDEPAELRVKAFVSGGANSVGALRLPKQASFRVYDRGVFKGVLAESTSVEASRLGFSSKRSSQDLVELVYVDATEVLSRTTENDIFKGLTVEDFLRQVASRVGLGARFEGDFGAPLPAFNVLGNPFLEYIQKLSFPYGFYYCSRSFSSEWVFLRLDRYIMEGEIDLAKGAGTLSAKAAHRSRCLYQSGELRFFDSTTQKSETLELSPDQLYEPLGYLKASNSYKQRLSRAHLLGREERVATQAKQFEAGKQLFANDVSKQAVGQSALVLETLSLPALPGDKLNVKGSRDSNSDGQYLVREVSVEIKSSQPVVRTSLLRA